MGRHRNKATNVVVSVADDKDDRFDDGAWEHLAADDSGEPAPGNTSGQGGVPVPPPLGGEGSGESDWRAYAKAVGVDVTGIEHRDEIVDAVRAAGKPVGNEDPVPPPLGGPGSGVDAWRAYAVEVKVDVDGLKGRDEIVDAVRAAGKPVEAEEK